MRIVWVSHSAGLAGAERALLEGVKGLSSDGISINVVVPSRGPLVPALNSQSVSVSVMSYGWWMSPNNWRSLYYRPANCARNFGAWPKVLRFLREQAPDLVVTNTLTIPIWALASKHLGLPHVWYLHESGTAEEDAFDLGNRWTFKLIDALSTLIIVNSKSAGSGLNPLIPREKIRLATYAVETPVHLNGRNGNHDILRMALVGRVCPNKGQAEAIEAMSLLVRQGMKVHLKIVGNTESQFSRQLRERTSALDLGSNVEFVPFSDNPFEHVIDTDLALMCSHKEAFGRVTVEAMKMGKPVVGAAIDATRELIQDGCNGLLYRAGDANDLAQKIGTLYHDRERLAVMSERARTWASDRFTTKGYSNDLRVIFEEAISLPVNSGRVAK
jgi:glycosyltransferase involved in cell wall biosynthesis